MWATVGYRLDFRRYVQVWPLDFSKNVYRAHKEFISPDFIVLLWSHSGADEDTVFWDVTPSGLISYGRFGGA